MLKEAAIKQLESIRTILLQIESDDYTAELNTLKNASVGKHIRHILEFYECLLFNSVNDTVNYDNRKRNILLEENVTFALDFLTEIVDTITTINSNKRLILTSNYQDQSVSMESSLYREITYNIEHTVHHLAIISIAIPIHFDYINLSANFGYAESTINYLKQQNAR
jgi:hypothetical protein